MNWPLRRRILSRFANNYIRAVTRLSAHDCTSGYRCWQRGALAELPLDAFVSDGYSFLVEMLFVAARRGCRIAEVPITFVERRDGESKVSRAVLLESAITPWRLISNPSANRQALGRLGMTADLPDYRRFYRDRRVMITGGLGFIGSNLARQLVALGADVLLVDSLIPDYGGNLFNIDGIRDQVRVNVADVRQQSTMNYLVQDREVIFNLAGQVSHIDSMNDPYADLEINCRSQLTLLEACRYNNPGVKVVFAGTRQIYGRPSSLPVNEQHLVRPTDVNGINKAAGEYYHLVYNNVFGDPRLLAAAHERVRTAPADSPQSPGLHRLVHPARARERTIQIYGDGTQLRDFVFVDDAADAFLRAGAERRLQRRGLQCRRRRPDQPSRPDGAAPRVAGIGPRRVRRLAAGEESDRHRRTSTPTRRNSRAPPAGSRRRRSADGLTPHAGVLSRAFRPLRGRGRPAERIGMTALRIPCSSPAPREDREAVRAAIDRVARTAAGSSSDRKSSAFEAEFAAACRRRRMRSASATEPTRSP